MPQSLSQVYVHIIFSTKHRVNMIDEKIENRLFSYIGSVCKDMSCIPLQIGGYQNHVHILCKLSREVSQSHLVQHIKQYSSKWIKTMDSQYSSFYWQRGYGIFSVDGKHVETLKHYIKNQSEHHQKIDFKKEYLKLLGDHNLRYDPKYVWD